MTDIDIKALREAAERLRSLKDFRVPSPNEIEIIWRTRSEFSRYVCTETVLALLDRLEAAEDRAKKLDAEANRYVNDMLDACKERDASETTLAAKAAECERLREALGDLEAKSSAVCAAHARRSVIDYFVDEMGKAVVAAREALAPKEAGDA